MKVLLGHELDPGASKKKNDGDAKGTTSDPSTSRDKGKVVVGGDEGDDASVGVGQEDYSIFDQTEFGPKD